MPPIGKPPKTIIIGGGVGSTAHKALMVSAMIPHLVDKVTVNLAEQCQNLTVVPDPEGKLKCIRAVGESIRTSVKEPVPKDSDSKSEFPGATKRLKALVALNPGMRINPKRQAKKAKKK